MRRRRAFLVPLAVFALALAASSCRPKKKAPSTDELPADEVSSDDLVREQKRIAKGESVGDALRAPRLEVDASAVSINGRLVATTADVDSGLEDADVGPGSFRIDKVFAWTKGLREHWKQIHPGQDFSGHILVVASTDAEAPFVERVIGSAAASGYTNAHVKVGAIEWDAPLWTFEPRHPEPDDGEKLPPQPRLVDVALRRGGEGYEVAVTSRGPPCKHTPSAGKGEELRAVVATACADATRCRVSVVPSPDTFANVAALLAPAFGPGAPPSVVLDSNFNRVASTLPCGEPNTSSPSAGSDAGIAPFGSGPIRFGAATVTGRLPPEVIQRIVRTNTGRLGACYENGRRTHPALTGRVLAKLVIGRDGNVVMTADGGSDLPDAEVVSCVVRSFGNLSFPQPEAGVVVVTYPILFFPPK